MNRNLKTAATIAALGAAALLSGCAFVPMTVHSHYTPPANVTKVPEAEKVVVDVVVKNEKKHKVVSRRTNAYDMHIAGVYLDGGVSKSLKDAIDAGLRARGFETGASGKTTVDVDLKKFYVHEDAGFWAGHTAGDIEMSIVVRTRSDAKIYTTNVSTSEHEGGLFLTGVGHTGDALDVLMNNGVNKLLDDPKFIHALLAAGK